MDIAYLKEILTSKDLLSINIGIEREMLRCNYLGNIADTDHKKCFGNKLYNPYITTDFSESQLELITPVFNNTKDVCNFLDNLYNICSNEYSDEFMFPLSTPCRYQKINIAKYEKSEQGQKASKYRKNLLQKYGPFKQLLSGIHYNFSFNNLLIQKLYKSIGHSNNIENFKNNLYLSLSSKYLYYRWFIEYLFGASPYIEYESDFKDEFNKQINDFNTRSSISFRNSSLGYTNKNKIHLNYDSLDDYVLSVSQLLKDNILSEYRELYTKVRLKSKVNDGKLDSLLNYGIEYIEIRNIDINPYEKNGISQQMLDFLNLFMISLLFFEDKNCNIEADYNSEIISKSGLDNVLLKRDGKTISREEYSLDILNKIKEVNDLFLLGMDDVIEYVKKVILDSSQTIAYRIKHDIMKNGYINFAIELSKKYKLDAHNNRYKLTGYEDLELSTQVLIKEAIKYGLNIEILDRSDNFIAISDSSGHTEYVKQATKTAKDNYTTVLAMENKVVTKRILDKNNIRVPKGYEFSSLCDAKEYLDYCYSHDIVIKPKSTNFGKGITIIKKNTEKHFIISAIKKAFSYDSTIIIEEYIKGNEYRFLVINDRVSAILRRVPANVSGNGKNTIKELIDIKNEDPLRQKGYKSPLEKIEIDDTVLFYLQEKGLDLEYIPQKDEIIYLRQNSNISTGGDSIDYTDTIYDKFKKIAVDAAKALDAKICGVDMIIEDLENQNSNYAIIELNFNPAIHIHCFPYIGKERNIGFDILELLGFIK